MNGRSMFVRVLAGAVVTSGLWGAPSLQAAEKKPPRPAAPRAAPQGGKVVGIVTAKSDKDIMVKADGESEARRYLLVPEGGTPKADLQAALKTVFVPNLVVLEWQGQDQPVVANIRVILPSARRGTVTGTVVARDNTPREVWIEVKPNGPGYTQRYWCQWKEGGFDKDVARVIGESNAGDKVNLAWFYDERARAAQIQIVSRAKPKPAGRKGTPDRTP
jgi:hypothetical protein